MSKWNQFSEEVRAERKTVRAYGIDKVNDRCRVPDSYKAQALRELAVRLEMESEIDTLRSQVSDLINQVEELQTELNIRSSK